ncbi:MAG TPA: protein translocase subunit SecD [Ilumatobacteraceae bacterium]
MRRKLVYPLVAVIVIAVGLLAVNLSLGYKPALGLDLRGGISVTLQPVGTDWNASSLDLAVERIRARVDSVGVGEPDIVRQLNAIVVNLPGVNDQQKALDLVTVTGKVYLRPVLACAADTSTSDTTPDTTPESTPTSDGASTTVAGASTTAVSGTSAGTTPASTGATTAVTAAPGPSRAVHSASAPSTDTTPPTTPVNSSGTTSGTTSGSTAGDGTAVPTAVAPTGASTAGSTPTSDTATPGTDAGVTTTTEQLISDPTQTEVLKTTDGEICQVGPSEGDGTVFSKDSAQAQIINGAWGVTVDLKSGSSGEGVWNALASECYSGASTCPTHRLAIQLDTIIESAPTVNEANFTGSVEITGKFSEHEAENLAQVLNSGALPITLKVQAIDHVSATLGKDSLRAALIAGAIGVALVLLFMVLYYRRLALVVVVGLTISGALIYSATSLISRFYSGVLSLSGVAGLIVSIGVTIDSYVVFFERLKDEVRSGRSLRNSAQRGFKAAFRTILIADSVSLIGAIVLWYLSVGAVRGFAFYLGLSTAMDVFVAYFFTRPAVLLLARSRFMSGKHVLGLDSHEATPPPDTTGATS